MILYEMTVKYKAIGKDKSITAVTNPQEAAKYFRPLFKRNPVQETFIVMPLNAANEPLGIQIVSIGTTNQTIVHPRDTFRIAVLQNAVSVVVAHNHPSGSLVPSAEDLIITEMLCKAGSILNIPVQDHLIVTHNGFKSLREEFPGAFK